MHRANTLQVVDESGGAAFSDYPGAIACPDAVAADPVARRPSGHEQIEFLAFVANELLPPGADPNSLRADHARGPKTSCESRE